MATANPSTRYRVTIIVRPQKAELLCRHVLEQHLLDQLTVEETLGHSRGGSIPRAELNGFIDAIALIR